MSGSWHFIVGDLLSLLICLVSFAASLLLLVWLWNLSETLAKRLMSRQLLHLALADVLQAVIVAPKFVLALLHLFFNVGVESSDVLDGVCFFAHLDNLPYMTSVFAEVHIALATLFTIFHCNCALAILGRILPFVWLLGFGLGGAVVGLGSVSWDPSVGNCNPQVRGEYLRVAVLTGALGICIATYFAGVVAGCRHAGDLVRLRQQNHARLFVAAAVVTWLPFVVFTFSSRTSANYIDGESDKIGLYFVQAFMSANGLFNAAVYAVKSGFVRRTVRREMELERRGELPTSRSASIGTTPQSHSAPQSHGSFNVAFNVDNDVVPVTALTATANRRAARETAAMVDGESGSFASDIGEGDGDFLACFDESEPSTTSI